MQCALQAHKLLDEWLIPICAPGHVGADLSHAELIHPSPDRRDLRRWLAAMQPETSPYIERGKYSTPSTWAADTTRRASRTSITTIVTA
ncbi:hypothetical protein [Pseudomonas sp. CHM02]|uniref:hypothetical protein n=1 Tax=Pseudomonas sp. CHM02 TaxID=1463662 RepID=UPI0012DFC453|nr:hypothetical protein [Pseudomonas sp. CHM02]